MIRLVSPIILCLSVLASATSSSQAINKRTAFVVDQQKQSQVSSISSNVLFGVRGGGLFGGKDDEKAVADAAGGRKTYPAMSQEEVEDWLEHIPVYAVTDSNGAGVVLKPDDDSSVFYFFLSPLAANATLTQLKSTNEEMDLKVSVRTIVWIGGCCVLQMSICITNLTKCQGIFSHLPIIPFSLTLTGIQLG